MLGARDLPFPRLSAYAFWAYFDRRAGLLLQPLLRRSRPTAAGSCTRRSPSDEYSPGINADFWLLGIGFIEISAIAGAIEIIVGILRTRAPGMTLGAHAGLRLGDAGLRADDRVRLPGGDPRPPLLLELERAFDWPFFIAERGGDPLLWQHLFWFFGHPEVYIIFLPAAGMVSMIVPAMARTPLVGYRLVVLALVGDRLPQLRRCGCTTCSPPACRTLSLSFFSAASMAVAIPSGIQVFAWIATLAARPRAAARRRRCSCSASCSSSCSAG